MHCCVMQVETAYSSFEILPDDTVRYSPGALKSIKCNIDTERGQAAADPQSPVRSSLLQNGQAEPLLDINQMSPKQLQEAVDQHIEDDKQLHKSHQFCGAASVKVHRPDCTQGQDRLFCMNVCQCQHFSKVVWQQCTCTPQCKQKRAARA